MDHYVPLGMLAIDFAINSILFNPWHLIITIIVMVLYGIVNFTATMVSGNPIYPIMTWKDIGTLYYALGILAATILSFALFSFVSIFRHSKINK